MVVSVKRKLSDEDVQLIVGLLETWDGPLTWQLLSKRVALVLGRSFSRQALDSHQEIKATYQARKRRDRIARDSVRQGKVGSEELPPDLVAALRRVEAAELRALALQNTVDRYREKFVVWLYNARNMGMTEDQLNAMLPNTDQKSGALWSKKRGGRA